MTPLDKTIQPQISGLAKVWQRIPVLIKTILKPKFVRSNSSYEISQ